MGAQVLSYRYQYMYVSHVFLVSNQIYKFDMYRVYLLFSVRCMNRPITYLYYLKNVFLD